ncbi:MAG: MSHA biogenesis protein MshK [Herminiimonas sp.]|nr:MSHA biogenesis protein MshK [Herminiimonas sp.]
MRGAIGVLALTLPLIGFAEGFADPMRPPTTFIQASTPSTASSLSASGPVLQSVYISPRRTVATISGQTVMLGEKVGDATVMRISENEVVLRSGKNLQTLKLFPAIDKREPGKTLSQPARIDRKE